MRDVRIKFLEKPAEELPRIMSGLTMPQRSVISRVCRSMRLPWEPVILGVDTEEYRAALVEIIKCFWWDIACDHRSIQRSLGRSKAIIMAAMFAKTSRRTMGVDGRWRFSRL